MKVNIYCGNDNCVLTVPKDASLEDMTIEYIRVNDCKVSGDLHDGRLWTEFRPHKNTSQCNLIIRSDIEDGPTIKLKMNICNETRGIDIRRHLIALGFKDVVVKIQGTTVSNYEEELDLVSIPRDVTFDFKPNAVWFGYFMSYKDCLFRIDKNVPILNPLSLHRLIDNLEGNVKDAITDESPTDETNSYIFRENKEKEIECKLFDMSKMELVRVWKKSFPMNCDMAAIDNTITTSEEYRNVEHPCYIYVNGKDMRTYHENYVEGWITSVVVYSRGF